MERLPTHILIVGSNGVGKSSLLARLLREQLPQAPLAGFYTKKEPPDADGVSRVYIHPAGKPKRFGADNLVGVCAARSGKGVPEAFERAAALLEGIPADAAVLMDELGVMERDSPRFQAAVLRALDGPNRVFAAVRDKQDGFLAAVRAHPRAQCFFITPENRDALYGEALAFLRADE